MMSPMYSSGVVTDTSMMGSRSTGPAFSATLRNASVPATLKAMSDEIDRMVRPVVAFRGEVLERVPGQDTLRSRLLDSALHRREVLGRYHSTFDLALELESLPSRERFQANPAIAELSAATALLLESALAPRTA